MIFLTQRTSFNKLIHTYSGTAFIQSLISNHSIDDQVLLTIIYLSLGKQTITHSV